MLRALQFGPTVPRRAHVAQAPLFSNVWAQAPAIDAQRLSRFVYQGQALEPLSQLGASYHAPRHPVPIGSVPMIVTQTASQVGLATMKGQFRGTPLSRNPGVSG